jgi:dihydrofolate reductase
MPSATRIELTEIAGTYEGDTVMPPLGPEWHAIARADHPADGDRPAHAFVTLTRAL